jgi:uncharacterized protein YbjT (DUF2867 family)
MRIRTLLSLLALLVPANALVLVVGATGGTGIRAIRGLMDTGLSPKDIVILTRNNEKPVVKALESAGFRIVVADLDNPETLKSIPRECDGCYVHSTAADTKKLDTGEAQRAQHLAASLLENNSGVKSVVFNSAVGEPGHGVIRVQQKHDCEDAYVKSFANRDIRFTSLRANLFMEELWKGYVRPQVLKGKFSFALAPSKKLYLTSVRDMGRLAGRILGKTSDGDTVRILNVASDHLSCPDMAATYAEVQGTPCRHTRARLLGLFARLFFRDLYSILRYNQVMTETSDIQQLNKEFPGDMTSFLAFLKETHWEDTSRNFESLVDFSDVVERQHD